MFSKTYEFTLIFQRRAMARFIEVKKEHEALLFILFFAFFLYHNLSICIKVIILRCIMLSYYLIG